jgi:hypothetical protein
MSGSSKRLSLSEDIIYPAGIKSPRATLPDEIFYWGFCFLNRAFNYNVHEKPTNSTIIHSIY